MNFGFASPRYQSARLSGTAAILFTTEDKENMNKTATAFFFGLFGLAAFGGMSEDADYICETFFHYRHGIPGESLRAYAREHGFSDDDLLERLKYISETRWDSENPRTHLEAECAVDVMGMLKMTNAIPYLEKQLYRGENRCTVALYALQYVLDYDESFLDILENAVQNNVLPRLNATCILYGAIRRLTSESIALENNEKDRIYRTLLLYPPDQGNLGLDADWHDNQLCQHMKDYPRSKERLEQVALLAANTNASPALREKYAGELEKMKAIPEDELICLLDLYPPSENELAQTRKDVIDKRADVETKETRPSATNPPHLVSTSAGHGDGHPVYSRPVVVLAAAAVGIVGALVFVRKRRRK